MTLLYPFLRNWSMITSTTAGQIHVFRMKIFLASQNSILLSFAKIHKILQLQYTLYYNLAVFSIFHYLQKIKKVKYDERWSMINRNKNCESNM